MKVREKKRLYHTFLDDKTLANWQEWQPGSKESDRCYPSGLFQITLRFTLGMARKICVDFPKTETQDIEDFCCVNDMNGTLLINRRVAMERWREYFGQISTEEFARPPLPIIVDIWSNSTYHGR